MPQRFLKPGITSSEKWNFVSFFAQSLYIRILTLVDDYGRYDGRLSVIKSGAFPLNDDSRANTVSLEDVENGCNELGSGEEPLISFYSIDNKPFLQLSNWTERTRSSTSKYPVCNVAASCGQLTADVGNLRQLAATCGNLRPPSSPSPSPSIVHRSSFIVHRSSDARAAGVTALPLEEQKPKPPKFAPQLSDSDWSTPDPQVEILALLQCLEGFPWLAAGRRSDALYWISQEFAKYQTPVVDWCAGCLARAQEWHVYYKSEKLLKPKMFVPNIGAWFQDGKYAQPPPQTDEQLRDEAIDKKLAEIKDSRRVINPS